MFHFLVVIAVLIGSFLAKWYNVDCIVHLRTKNRKIIRDSLKPFKIVKIKLTLGIQNCFVERPQSVKIKWILKKYIGAIYIKITSMHCQCLSRPLNVLGMEYLIDEPVCINTSRSLQKTDR